MNLTYRELTDNKEVNDYYILHKRIFLLCEKDAYPPSFFSMVIRNEHPLGFVLGAYDNENLVGMVVAVAGNVQNSVYIPFMGLDQNYRRGKHAYNLILNFKETVRKKGYTRIFGIFDPLEANLGKIYSHLGAIFYNYTVTPYTLSKDKGIPKDKILFEYNLENNGYKDKHEYKSLVHKEIIEKYPVVDSIECSEKNILIEIPINFSEIEIQNREKAIEYRNFTSKLFSHYINKNGYVITQCISSIKENTKKIYYFLQKKENELI